MSNELTPIENLIEEDFGKVGTPERDAFEMECDAFIIGEQLKEERFKAGLTQDELERDKYYAICTSQNISITYSPESSSAGYLSEAEQVQQS